MVHVVHVCVLKYVLTTTTSAGHHFTRSVALPGAVYAQSTMVLVPVHGSTMVHVYHDIRVRTHARTTRVRTRVSTYTQL
jgi:hypothetical protein